MCECGVCVCERVCEGGVPACVNEGGIGVADKLNFAYPNFRTLATCLKRCWVC